MVMIIESKRNKEKNTPQHSKTHATSTTSCGATLGCKTPQNLDDAGWRQNAWSVHYSARNDLVMQNAVRMQKNTTTRRSKRHETPFGRTTWDRSNHAPSIYLSVRNPSICGADLLRLVLQKCNFQGHQITAPAAKKCDISATLLSTFLIFPFFPVLSFPFLALTFLFFTLRFFRCLCFNLFFSFFDPSLHTTSHLFPFCGACKTPQLGSFSTTFPLIENRPKSHPENSKWSHIWRTWAYSLWTSREVTFTTDLPFIYILSPKYNQRTWGTTKIWQNWETKEGSQLHANVFHLSPVNIICLTLIVLFLLLKVLRIYLQMV